MIFDPSDWHTYALLDDAGGRFELSGSELRVRDGVRLDYEQASHHTVVIRTTDTKARQSIKHLSSRLLIRRPSSLGRRGT